MDASGSDWCETEANRRQTEGKQKPNRSETKAKRKQMEGGRPMMIPEPGMFTRIDACQVHHI
jgi:hypothetical protein